MSIVTIDWEGASEMMDTATLSPRMLSGVAATAVLLAAGLTPVAVAPGVTTHAVARVSAEVVLTGSALTDGIDGILGDVAALDTPGAADAFDIAGLFNAELAAAQGFFNSLFSLPGTLFNDVQNLITSLVNLDFGMAFSEAVTIPQDIINYVLGLPGLVVNTIYNMVVVLPGEYLFNFG
ncbi:hypothetical protein MTER_32810 [Mycolicibacter terrae]|uniref:Uncharacterized protein n=1 Tax=Mycolicibacter terrae TaxID=1788 RepID=A0AAD1I141_9MYCO|nr:hypothetical protein [Mycolicibacter terrae]ORW98303.1 hypothetical protein AWC28_06995 [Mycolicibacter terrae]BBX23870.1 hypothetical protein MTER_32810 [Mycolicibacter terrae]SNV59088.1 Uncharacterised protein [Mycolicibacter terrae]